MHYRSNLYQVNLFAEKNNDVIKVLITANNKKNSDKPLTKSNIVDTIFVNAVLQGLTGKK